MAESLLAIDLGTSACKTVLFEPDGSIVASATAEYPIYTPHPGWAEQNPEEWWRAAVQTIHDVLEESASPPERIAGVGLDSQSGAAVCLAQDGQPVRPATIYIDKRSAPICARLAEMDLPTLLRRVNGNPLDTSLVAPRLLWLKEQEPEAYDRIAHILPGSGYLAYRLTGELGFSISEGAFTGLFDTARGRWSPELAEAWGLGLEHFAPLRAPHEVVGHVTRRAAEETGLPAGIPVVAGAMDAAASVFGMGAIRGGQAIGMLGTSFSLLVAVERPIRGSGLWIYHAAIPGLWILGGNVDAAGGALRWLRDEVAAEEREQARREGVSPYEVMTRAAATVPPGSDGLIFLPYLAGARAPKADPHRRGVFFGLTLKHTRAHLIRAVLEGCAFGLRYNLDAVRNAGMEVDELRVCGGASASDLWVQIIADVCQVPLIRSDIMETSCLGSAMLAGMGVGLYRDAADAVANTATQQEIIAPLPKRAKQYELLYELFRQVDEALDESFASLSNF
ncbi:MAG: FGGY family carbohydrate kinase [Chloroflexota bacterium]|nr:FGGY family carbohydrate kinase [Chloroflexota bacterium]